MERSMDVRTLVPAAILNGEQAETRWRPVRRIKTHGHV